MCEYLPLSRHDHRFQIDVKLTSPFLASLARSDTVPVGQNPTGATMGGERKKAIYEVCVKHGKFERLLFPSRRVDRLSPSRFFLGAQIKLILAPPLLTSLFP